MTAEFITSATEPAGFPREALPEVAFAGRSNVGKSSLINALVRTKIARTSAAPGKTRLANFYRVTPDGPPPFFLVDLPGYGYARGGAASAREFELIASAYFKARARGAARSEPGVQGDQLAGVLLLVDSRHPGLESDIQAWNWLRHIDVPCQVIATKVDKLTRRERVRNLQQLERLHEGPVVAASATTGEGLKELWKTIDERLRWLRQATHQRHRPNR